MGFWIANGGFVTVTKTLDEPDNPLLSVTVAVNVLVPALRPVPTITVLVHTFAVRPFIIIVTAELAPMEPASRVTPVTTPSPLVVVTLTTVLWPRVNAVG